MRMSYLAGAMLGLLCVACATPPDSAARVDDALFVLPGPFSEQTTLADLQAYFGRANVRIVEPGDNAGERRVVLFEADPSRRAFVEFHDAAKLAGVRSIAVRDAASRWRGKQGVHVGMSFAELRERNGKPFGFSGFDQDGTGTAHDQWSPAIGDDATLGKLDVEEGERMYFDVRLGLRAGAPATDKAKLPRDSYFPSDDPRIPSLAPLLEVVGFGASTSLDDEWE